MEKELFDWGIGKVTYWALDPIDLDRSAKDQIQDLQEDLAQIIYGDEICIDIGWYPECSSDGTFGIHVIRDGNWDEPMLEIRFRSIELLVPTIKFAVTMADPAAALRR